MTTRVDASEMETSGGRAPARARRARARARRGHPGPVPERPGRPPDRAVGHQGTHAPEALLEAEAAGDLADDGGRPRFRSWSATAATSGRSRSATTTSPSTTWATATATPTRSACSTCWLAEYDVDLIVLARYMRILSPEVVFRYEGRIINVHPSLLPAFPGAEAYRQAKDAGVRVAGVTAHYVTTDLDQGPVIAQRAFDVPPGADVAEIKRRGQPSKPTCCSTRSGSTSQTRSRSTAARSTREGHHCRRPTRAERGRGRREPGRAGRRGAAVAVGGVDRRERLSRFVLSASAGSARLLSARETYRRLCSRTGLSGGSSPTPAPRCAASDERLVLLFYCPVCRRARRVPPLHRVPPRRAPGGTSPGDAAAGEFYAVRFPSSDRVLTDPARPL